MSKESRNKQKEYVRSIVSKYHTYKKSWTKEQFFAVFYELQPELEVYSEFIDMYTPLVCYCKNHKFEWEMIPYRFVLEGNGCPKCAQKNNGKRYSQAIRGVNDIVTLYPDLVKYFKNKDDAYIYKRQSNHKVDLVCPYCNSEKKMAVYSLVSRGFSCQLCGDGVSYPNKIGRMFAMQLPVENIEFEWKPSWLPGLRRFDIKFEYNHQIYVVEMDGYQHYVEDISFTHKQLWEIKKEDRLKDNLCKKNKVKIFRINCKENTLKWIREKIIESELGKLFDLSIIDWAKCDLYAKTSLIIKTGNLWNKGMDLLQISQELKISRNTIQRYIKIAHNIGICEYSKSRGLENGIRKNSRSVRWLDRNQEFINCKRAAESIYKQTGIKLSETGIRSVASGKYKHTKGFHFIFCDLEENITSEDIVSKRIYCYNMAGNYLKEYESILEASRELDILPQSIYNCCIGKTKKSGNRVWKYAGDVSKKENLIVDYTKKGIKIDCLTLEGEYIESFPNAMVAIRKYIKATNSGIARCCKGTQKTSGGYQWRYSK